jgi:TolB-like protein/tetratricopeptide (TPR) repeat protein
MKPSLFGELRRRKVIRVALAYAVVALAVMEAADLIVAALYLPEQANQIIVLLAVLGFPITVGLAWAFEITPDGVRREREPDGSPARPRRPGAFRRVAAGFAVTGALALVLWLGPLSQPREMLVLPTVVFLDSVAVLPLENRTGDSSYDYLSSGIMERMVGRLMDLGQVKVTDPFSSRRYAEQTPALNPRQLADSLRVEKLVYGSLYSDTTGLRVEIFTSLGESATPLWDATYEADSSAGPDPATAIADSFVSDYTSRTPALQRSTLIPGRTHVDDYGLLAEGREALGRRTAEGLASARLAFAAAAEADSMDAHAFAGLSSAHSLSLAYRYGTGNRGYRDAALALAYANRAIELDPDIADGYSARIFIATRSSAPPDAVIPDCQHALEIAPSSAAINSWCARVFNQQGDPGAALESLQRAISLDPGNAGRRLAFAYSALQAGEAELAIEQAREARRIQPELMLPRSIEARALLLAGRADECVDLDLGPHDGIRAACLHDLGRTDEARAIVDSLAAAVHADALPDTVFTPVIRAEDLAMYYGWIGDADGASEWAIEAYRMSPLGVEMRVLESPLFSRVRNDQRFRREVSRERLRLWQKVENASRQIM